VAAAFAAALAGSALDGGRGGDRGAQHLGHGLVQGPVVLAGIGHHAFLPVIGIDPDVVVAAIGTVGGLPDARDAIVDAAQGEVGELGGGPAPVGLLVVAHEVDMHHR